MNPPIFLCCPCTWWICTKAWWFAQIFWRLIPMFIHYCSLYHLFLHTFPTILGSMIVFPWFVHIFSHFFPQININLYQSPQGFLQVTVAWWTNTWCAKPSASASQSGQICHRCWSWKRRPGNSWLRRRRCWWDGAWAWEKWARFESYDLILWKVYMFE